MARLLMTSSLFLIARTLFQLADAQMVPSPEVQRQPSASAPAPAEDWEFSVAAFTYILPHATTYVSPYFRADRDWLHLSGATTTKINGLGRSGWDTTLAQEKIWSSRSRLWLAASLAGQRGLLQAH